MNTTYSYHIVAKYDDCEIEFRTNKIDIACGEFYQHFGESKSVAVIDGYTGEVLADWDEVNGLSTCPEWKYLLAGWVVLNL